MLRRSPLRGMSTFRALRQPPKNGYEVSLIPDEGVLDQFLSHHRDRLAVVIVGNGAACPATERLTKLLHYTPMGDPKEVKLCLLNGQQAKTLIKDHTVMAYPTSLLYHGGELVGRVVGVRPGELAVKTKFWLRNHDRNVFAVLSPEQILRSVGDGGYSVRKKPGDATDSASGKEH